MGRARRPWSPRRRATPTWPPSGPTCRSCAAQLAAAHAASLGRDEAELGWALSAATTDTLEHAADAAPVSDPVALVEDARTKGTRRRRTRTAALAAVLALVVAGATALAWPGPATTTTPGLARDSPRWNVVSSWTPRGPLVDDPTVRSIVAGVTKVDPPARLLYAGPVGDTIALVMMGTAPVDPSLPDGVPGPALGEGFDSPQQFLRLWTVPARLGPRGLAPESLYGDPTPRTGDLVALSVEQDADGAAPAVLVMTRPTVTDVYVTTGALPQPDGSHLPVVQVLPLVDGVAAFTGATDGFTPRIADLRLRRAAGRRGAELRPAAPERTCGRRGRHPAPVARRGHRPLRGQPQDDVGAGGDGARRRRP